MRAVLRIAAILVAFAAPAHAQDFPTKPIKLIVPSVSCFSNLLKSER